MQNQIKYVLQEAYRRGWITMRDGNVSIRIHDTFFISPSGVRKQFIETDDLLCAGIGDNKKLNWVKKYKQKPSGELEMHKMLQTTPLQGVSTRAVLHLHPTAVVAAMEKGFDLQKIAKHLQELSRYTNVGENVPRLPVTSKILAKETFSRLTDGKKIVYDIVGQEGHGITAVANDAWLAFEHCERLNHACEIILLSGITPEELSGK